MKKIKVAVITNAIPNYRFKIFNDLHNRNDIDLKVFVSFSLGKSCLLAQQNLNLFFSKGLNLKYKSYHKSTKVEQVEALNIPFSLPVDIFKFKPDIIISGEMGLKSLMAYFVARVLKIPFSIWTEEINETAKQISWIQKVIRNYLFNKSTSFLAWGAPAYEHVIANGVAKSKVFRCTQSVDNEYWQSTVSSFLKPDVRKELNLSGRIFLLTGRLVARKGFDKFFLAWSKLPEALRNQHSVVLVGDGEEMLNLKELVSHLSINNVHFIGSVTQQELPKFYAVADVFVFPSLVDVWGLVVNEALASGLPVLASKYAGATQELVCKQDVGQVIDPVNVNEFSEVLLEWCDKDLSVFKTRAWNVISPIDYKVTVNAFDALIKEYGK